MISFYEIASYHFTKLYDIILRDYDIILRDCAIQFHETVRYNFTRLYDFILRDCRISFYETVRYNFTKLYGIILRNFDIRSHSGPFSGTQLGCVSSVQRGRRGDTGGPGHPLYLCMKIGILFES